MGTVAHYLSFNVPFCTWLILGYFRSIPEELEGAARIDGCSQLGVLWRIVLHWPRRALSRLYLWLYQLVERISLCRHPRAHAI
ncbi:MAG: ABC transporter permease subunit [Caldilineaceae bacterium]